MEIADKRTALARVYRIYQTFIDGRRTACREGCAHCCTANVTLTTLEAYEILLGIGDTGGRRLLEQVRAVTGERRFRPAVTLNHMARLAAEGREIPDEHADPSWGPCPLLGRDACPVYRFRPFGCRSMVSDQPCAADGAARMDPLVVTVNTVFQQVIEHIDTMGCTGNLADVLSCLADCDHRDRYETDRLLCQGAGLLPNRPLKVLMVPPEHRERVRPILAELSAVHTASGR